MAPELIAYDGRRRAGDQVPHGTLVAFRWDTYQAAWAAAAFAGAKFEASMFAIFLVFLGGGIGAALRHGVNVSAAQLFGITFPWGTLLVNVIGSFLIGGLAAYFAFRGDAMWTQPLRLFLTTGILGGFTTFSAFSLDFALLFERGEIGQGVAYVLASVGLSLAAIFFGLFVVRSMT
jgi:fluoride exporter